MREYKLLALEIGIGILVSLVPIVVVGRDMEHYSFVARVPTAPASIWEVFATTGFFYFGMIGVSFAAITLLAPRFKSPRAMMFSGTVVGVFYFALSMFLFDWIDSNGDGEDYSLQIAIIGLAALTLTWLYVRFKLDRTWFRFES